MVQIGDAEVHDMQHAHGGNGPQPVSYKQRKDPNLLVFPDNDVETNDDTGALRTSWLSPQSMKSLWTPPKMAGGRAKPSNRFASMRAKKMHDHAFAGGGKQGASHQH